MPAYSLEPRPVPYVETEFRRIATPLPVPESVPLIQRLQAAEPRAMQGQPPVIWDQAEGFLVRIAGVTNGSTGRLVSSSRMPATTLHTSTRRSESRSSTACSRTIASRAKPVWPLSSGWLRCCRNR